MTQIPIAGYRSEIEGEIAKGQLEAQGITCMLRLSDRGGALLNFGIQNGPTELLVEASDAANARKILGPKG